jgi:hypothetical protein
MREGHENRTDLYERAKAVYNHPDIHPDLAHRFASDPRLQPGHESYEHSGIGRMMIESGHIEAHNHYKNVVEPAQRAERLNEALKSVVKGKPETDPRLDPNSEHYAHSGIDRFMIQSYHNS